MTLAVTVPSKSTNSQIAWILAFMREIGLARVRTDRTPTIRSIVEEAGRGRAAEGRPVSFRTKPGRKQCVEQQARVLKSAVEYRWRVKIGARHSVVP